MLEIPDCHRSASLLPGYEICDGPTTKHHRRSSETAHEKPEHNKLRHVRRYSCRDRKDDEKQVTAVIQWQSTIHLRQRRNDQRPKGKPKDIYGHHEALQQIAG